MSPTKFFAATARAVAAKKVRPNRPRRTDRPPQHRFGPSRGSMVYLRRDKRHPETVERLPHQNDPPGCFFYFRSPLSPFSRSETEVYLLAVAVAALRTPSKSSLCRLYLAMKLLIASNLLAASATIHLTSGAEFGPRPALRALASGKSPRAARKRMASPPRAARKQEATRALDVR